MYSVAVRSQELKSTSSNRENIRIRARNLRLILSDDTPCPHEYSFSEKWRHMGKMVSLAGHAVSRTQQIFAVSEDVTHGFSISTHQNRVFRVSTSESRVSVGRHTKNF